MKTKLSIGELLTISSMLFGMMFGAGNLIFPAYLGSLAGKNVLPAAFGFLITGVGLPLLAVIALAITGSNGLLDLSSKVSKKFGYIFTCVLYLTIGPFFASPRCVTVPYEVGIKPLLPSSFDPRLALFLFSLLFFVLTLYFSLKPGKIMVYIGKILNPIFIGVLGILIVTALVNASGSLASFNPTKIYSSKAMVQGILDGYNTMDTLAGLAFGIIIINVVKKQGITKEEHIASQTIKAGVFSCLLMAIIYILVALAGSYSRSYTPIADNGGAVLSSISSHYFANFGTVLLAVIVFFACLKTVIGLVTSCASAFEEMFPTVFNYNKWVIIFAFMTFVISNAGLSSIIKISLPVLMMIYPISMTLIILFILGHFIHLHQYTIRITMGTVIVCSVLDFIKALPLEWITKIHLDHIMNFLGSYLPLFEIGFGWLIPTAIGLMIGYLIAHHKFPKKLNLN